MNWSALHHFRFEWPWVLALLLLVPAFWFVYVNRLRQRLHRLALHFSYTSVLAQIQTQPAVWKRLLFPVSASLVMICLIVGLARPTITARVPVNSADLMLVLDISLSMMAEDIRPNRMAAARKAAIDFVRALPPDARVGLEFFAGDNYVVSPPTDRHEEIIAYLQALKKEDLKPRTEIGSALQTALQVLKTHSPSDSEQSPAQPPVAAQTRPSASNSKKKPDRVVILLSDGDSHEGFPWDLAARQARQDNITVHTIGVGSSEGSYITYQGRELPVTFDENTLRQTASLGGGSYFRVFKEADFRRVYDQIQQRTIHYEQRDIDLAFVMAGCALTLILLGLGLAALSL